MIWQGGNLKRVEESLQDLTRRPWARQLPGSATVGEQRRGEQRRGVNCLSPVSQLTYHRAILVFPIATFTCLAMARMHLAAETPTASLCDEQVIALEVREEMNEAVLEL